MRASLRWIALPMVLPLASGSIAQDRKEPTATELSKNETPGKAIMRTFQNQEYEFRSAAEAMPEERWSYRAAAGLFKGEKPEFGPPPKCVPLRNK